MPSRQTARSNACFPTRRLPAEPKAEPRGKLHITATPPANPPANLDLTLTSLDKENASDDIPFEALKTFVDVFDTVKSNYIETVSNEVLMENAIRGMLARLDPHSAYMNEKEYQEFEQKSYQKSFSLFHQISFIIL